MSFFKTFTKALVGQPDAGGASTATGDGSTTWETVSGTTYNVVSSDNTGLTKELTNVAGCAVTVPAGLTWEIGQRCEFYDVSGLATFADDGVSVLESLSGDFTSAGAGAKMVIECTGTNTYKLYGEYGMAAASFTVPIGDETTALTTGTAKVTFRMPFAMTLTSVRASLTTASSSGTPTFDINDGGTTILSTKLTIDANEKTSTTAATAAVISDTALADDAEITIDIDTAGTGAAGAKITFIGKTPA